MKGDFDKLLSDILNGRGSSCLLLFGDDYEVREARKTIIDRLVAESQRDFNLERFDGRYIAWGEIQAALMTPPFLSGRKVVWVENAPYFSAREQKGEEGPGVLRLWGEGKKDSAGKLMLDLMAASGWTEEQWNRCETGSSLAPVMGLLHLGEPEEQEVLAEIIDYCKSQEMSLGPGPESDAHGLLGLVEGSLPPWDFLLLTASQVDRRTRLYKKFAEKGAVLELGLERERSGRPSREKLVGFIDRRIGLAGKKIESRARDLMLLRAGQELGLLRQELEKLLLYVGDRPTIGDQDVAAIVADQGAAWIFDLTRSVATRNAVAALCDLG
ncbi:MAG TPA: hypothetical protein VE131_01100, partial [Terriglobales bacterium]|nr:hypothetical protein [Terriglobales bacterium]